MCALSGSLPLTLYVIRAVASIPRVSRGSSERSSGVGSLGSRGCFILLIYSGGSVRHLACVGL